MSTVVAFPQGNWFEPDSAPESEAAASSLEAGDVLFFPNLKFHVEPQEKKFCSSQIASSAKNVSYNPINGHLSGTTLRGESHESLRSLIARFSHQARSFVRLLLPAYRDRLEVGAASFRPIEIAGRATSWRKDDSRLHVDSFPSRPVQGRRILRIFTNINPKGRGRVWRLGDDFEHIAERFTLPFPTSFPGSATLLSTLRITKSKRTSYDSLMLRLHDRMKSDEDYQNHSPQTRFEFPADTTWMAFTDQVGHAAMAGQYQLEQTLLLPVNAMINPERSPLRMLEQIVGRSLL